MRIIGILVAIWLAIGSGAAAGERAVVVELFTSQGCSACPPADALLGELAQRDDVIAMALHVDYWDYIGWKDVFADPSNTERQRAYSRAANLRSIYTPQMIVQGQDHVIGYKPMALADAIQAQKEIPDAAEIDITRDGNRIRVQVTADTPFGTQAVVQLAQIQPKATVTIRAGENRGRTLDYHNIVSSLTEIGRWDGSGRFEKTLRVDADRDVVVIVQAPSAGPILAAAQLR